MKKALTAIVLCVGMGLHAQNVGIGTSTPNANAKLDITATDKGLLIPRMDSIHRKAIPNTIGLLVYDSTTHSFWVNNGAAWQNMGASASGWSLTGNAGTNPSTNFLGTTDNAPLIFKVNNDGAGSIDVNSRNTGFGWQTLQANTSGTLNTALGSYAINANTSGANNTAIGNAALAKNQTGGANTAVGANALENTVVNYNSAFGAAALLANTVGTDNTATGNDALRENTIGTGNTATGRGALQYNMKGVNNTATGLFALRSNTEGNLNTVAGLSAMYANTSGSGNTVMGVSTLEANTTGNNNTAIGGSALVHNIIGNGNTATGSGALSQNTVDLNSAFGFNALAANTTGNQNSAHGAFALAANTTGFANTAVGRTALSKNSTGDNNAALGTAALRDATTGEFNTALGSLAMQFNTTGSNNTSVGYVALSNNLSGNLNTAMGVSALILNEGDENTAVGAAAMQGIPHSGSFNTALGAQSLNNHFGGSKNTAIGYKADLLNADPSVTITNATAIGANALVDASNKIRLGDINVTVVESNGVFNTVSDGRFKYNIQEDVKGLDFILQLRPVTYQFDTKKQEDFSKGLVSAAQFGVHALPAAYNETNSIKRTGFIAQEVEAAAHKTGYDFDGVKKPATGQQYYSLSYASFVVPLVKAMQEQQQEIDALKKQNELLQHQQDDLIKRLEALEKK